LIQQFFDKKTNISGKSDEKNGWTKNLSRQLSGLSGLKHKIACGHFFLSIPRFMAGLKLSAAAR